MRIYMQTIADENQAPKFYHIHVEQDLFQGWIVTKEWGAQGSSGRIQKKQFANAEDANAEAIESRDKQIKKGYRVVFVEGNVNQ